MLQKSLDTFSGAVAVTGAGAAGAADAGAPAAGAGAGAGAAAASATGAVPVRLAAAAAAVAAASAAAAGATGGAAWPVAACCGAWPGACPESGVAEAAGSGAASTCLDAGADDGCPPAGVPVLVSSVPAAAASAMSVSRTPAASPLVHCFEGFEAEGAEVEAAAALPTATGVRLAPEEALHPGSTLTFTGRHADACLRTAASLMAAFSAASKRSKAAMLTTWLRSVKARGSAKFSCSNRCCSCCCCCCSDSWVCCRRPCDCLGCDTGVAAGVVAAAACCWG
mmetsp:Transcript_8183/g.20262  ORF Transcript_8183/g.20262 Transcript_8183/m.20262 type:complete len:281 (+) Transcript_8183:882-1724(+)